MSPIFTIHQCFPHIAISLLSLWIMINVICSLFILKKRRKNKWPVLHKITFDCKVTYICKTNEWKFSWVYEMQKQLCETQADGSVYAVSIDPGVYTPFTWYSPTKGVSKIGQYDIGWIIRLCKYMDNLHSIRDKLAASNSKRKNKKALRLDNAISRMIRKIKHLQGEIHKKCCIFYLWIWCHYHSSFWGIKYGKSKNKKYNTKNCS